MFRVGYIGFIMCPCRPSRSGATRLHLHPFSRIDLWSEARGFPTRSKCTSPRDRAPSRLLTRCGALILENDSDTGFDHTAELLNVPIRKSHTAVRPCFVDQ